MFITATQCRSIIKWPDCKLLYFVFLLGYGLGAKLSFQEFGVSGPAEILLPLGNDFSDGPISVSGGGIPYLEMEMATDLYVCYFTTEAFLRVCVCVCVCVWTQKLAVSANKTRLWC